jgi:acetoin utilization protein AcuB
MKSLRVRHLPVTWDDALVGMVSDRDLLLHGTPAVDGSVRFPARKIQDVMTNHPVALMRTATVSQLAGLMLQHRIDCIPIVSADNSLVGLVTSSDLLELLTEPEHLSDTLPFDFSLRSAEDSTPPGA